MEFKDLFFALERALDHMLGAYEHSPPTSHNPALTALGTKYGLEIISEDSLDSQEVSYQALDERRKKIFADLLLSELNIYPSEIIRQSKLERIVLCSKLRSYGTEVAGLAQMGLLVVDTLYLDADQMSQDWEYATKAFHHELYHTIDFHDDLLHYIDPTWNELNPESFSYLHNRQNHMGYNESSDSPGFLSTYSKTSVHEDKAELFCHLIVCHSDLMERTRKDQFLARKVARMKELLQKFCDKFDDPFWSKVDIRSRRFRVSKYSQLKETHKLMEKMTALSQDGSVREKALLEVSPEVENGRQVWRAKWLRPAETDPVRPVRTFYSFNKLVSYLTGLGIREPLAKDTFLGNSKRFYVDTRSEVSHDR